MARRQETRPRLIAHREVARLVGVSTTTLRRWIAAGEWPEPIAVIGQTLFFPREPIERFLATGAWTGDVKFKPGVGKGRQAPASV